MFEGWQLSGDGVTVLREMVDLAVVRLLFTEGGKVSAAEDTQCPDQCRPQDHLSVIGLRLLLCVTLN